MTLSPSLPRLEGHDDPAAKETLWAAYNGITEYVDHWRARGERQHMYTVCLGRGFQIKSRAFSKAFGRLESLLRQDQTRSDVRRRNILRPP